MTQDRFNTSAKICTNHCPSWFTGHWADWHRGHGCNRDDGKSRSETAVTEIAQHTANKATGYLTDAELRLLRARTTSGDTLLVRALGELRERREAEKPVNEPPSPSFDHSALTRRFFEPLLGYCICRHCVGLPP